MQEKKQNISPIKQRILAFIAETGSSKREFYAKTGISRGTLESGSGITEDIMARFFAAYNNINAEWLLFGKGSPLKPPPITETDTTTEGKQVSKGNDSPALLALIREKDNKIQELCKQIGSLQERICTLKKECTHPNYHGIRKP